MDVVLGETTDAATVMAMLHARQVPGVRSVNLDEAKAAA